MQGIQYRFEANLWKHEAPGGWHFVTLPDEFSVEIRENLKWQEQGWGRMKANAEIDGQRWDTAIWFDTKRKAYLLPVKSTMRDQLGLQVNTSVRVAIRI
ncbi:MAG: DUF1905 domain-containing protein [Flavobacteriales bacterium]|nr:DUF1905 domain-containing protein [Flavobacteriales bacterium]